MAAQKGVCLATGFSLTGTPRNMDAEISNSTASASSANGAPVTLIRAPAAPGPATSAADVASAFLACASTKRSRGTICVSTICAALPAVVFTVPITKPTMYSQRIDSQPNHHAAGTVATVSATESSPTTYTGNLRIRSSHTPAGSEKKTNGTISAAVSIPICVGAACSSTAALNGSASSVTCPPKDDIRIDVHSRR